MKEHAVNEQAGRPAPASSEEPAHRSGPTERAMERLSRLQTITAALSAEPTIDRVVETIVSEGTKALEATAAVVAVCSADDSSLELVGGTELVSGSTEYWRRMPIEAQTPLAEAVRTSTPIWLTSTVEWIVCHPAGKAGTALTGHQAVAAIPLIIGDRTIGALGLAFAQARDFDEPDRQYALTLAQQCAQALDRARLYAAHRQVRDEAEGERDFLRQILDNAPIAIGVLEGPEHRITLANRACSAIAGIPLDQLLGRPAADLFPVVLREIGAAIDRVLKHRTIEHLRDVGVHRPDGRDVVVDVTFAPLAGAAGRLACVVYLAADVTAERRTEAERARLLSQERAARAEADSARQRATDILDSITDGFVALDRQARFTFINRRAGEIAEHYLKESPRELLGRSIWAVLPQMVGTTFHREYRRATTKHVAVHYEAHFAPYDVWLEVHAYPSHDGLSVYFRDITDRRRAEDERARLLAREQALVLIAQALVYEPSLPRVVDVVVDRSRQVLAADGVGVWLADPVHRVLTLLAYRGVNAAIAETVRQITFDEEPSIAALTARTEQMQIVEDVQKPEPTSPSPDPVIAQMGMRSIVALPLISRGRLVGVATYLSRAPRHFPVEDRRFLGTIADLFAVAIENAQLYDQVRQALRLREEFMAAVAHELRTPITVIRGRSQLLLMKDAGEPQTRQYLETILRHVDRVTLLVNDLLAVARVKPGSISLNRRTFDLTQLVRAEVDQVALTTERHQFEVKCDGPLKVHADRQLIGETIARLLENALRFAPEGGVIEVSTRRQNGEALVSVTDHGPGIPIARQPHAFEPFYELIPSGLPGYVGVVTLGLYLSKEIVEAHGGRIWVTSSPPSSHGSRFTFALPLAPSEGQVRTPSP